ncbi:MAG: citrate lyase holo-[acyl-carrier protein] synthase [Clostridium sp.]|nr:citrate lyase holo-[acyl-carrier protein] synthase [Clostridium sp.]
MEKKSTKENFIISKNQSTKHKTIDLYRELLECREKKCDEIVTLQKEFKEPVVTIRANYPGKDKNNGVTRFITAEIQDAFKEIFRNKINQEEIYEMPEGLTQFYSVRGDARTLKENAVYIEQNHPLGRFVNIDVYDHNEDYAVARIELFYEPRQCFLCDKAAKVCSKEENHRVEDLIEYMEDRILAYKEDKLK